MNVERWIGKRRPVWQKLETLLRQVDKRGLSALDRDGLQDLGRLYRSASADLSRARALNLGPDVLVYLNNLVVKAHNQVYQRQQNRWLDLFNFFYTGFPEVVRQQIVYVLAAVAIFALPALASWSFMMHDDSFAHMELAPGHPLVSEEMWNTIEKGKMWTDQVQDASPAFMALISTNNIKVCIVSFALGITGGVGTVYVLFLNGIELGTVFGACQLHGILPKVAAFVVGHGVLELPAIFISGAGGMLIGGALFFRANTGGDAFKMRAKPALRLFAGCVPLLLIAGTIESFISPRTDIPGEAKLLVGAAAFVCLMLYLFVPRKPLGAPATIGSAKR